MPIEILYICSHSPFAQAYGAQLRTLNIGRLLKRIGKVSMVLASIKECPTSEIALARKEFDLRFAARLVSEPVKSFRERLHRELNPYFLNTSGWRISPADAEQVAQMAHEADIVWVHRSELANALGLHHWPHSILDLDDVPSTFWQEKCKAATTVLERLRVGRFVWQWRRRERRLLERFTVLSVCSEADRVHLGFGSRVHVIPNGFDVCPRNRPHLDPSPFRVGFIGVLGYPPNVDGVNWFLEHVWHRIRQTVPGAELRLVGAGSDDPRFSTLPNVKALGFVEDVAEEIASWSAMIVPLHVGGGTRVKIAEAFARGCPVVSTSLGAYGYEVENGREIIIADTPESFADACVRILTDPALGLRLADAASAFFDARLSWDAIEPAVRATVEDCLQRARVEGAG